MYRRMFWGWLLILFVTWGLSLIHTYQHFSSIPAWSLFLTALFFGIYFILPLFYQYEIVLTFSLSILVFIITVTFWPAKSIIEPNLHVIILFSYLAGEATFRLSNKVYAFITVGIVFSSYILFSIDVFPLYFTIIYIAVSSIALAIFHHFYHKLQKVETLYEALLHEYRLLKRKSIDDERLARQEERTQIAREIHDRVGHKLTNLLMQLEIMRMSANDESKEQIALLKNIAKDSLEETRRAVRTMDDNEISGLSSVIHLIKKLEAENFVRINFTVKNRAFSVRLKREVIVAVYRAVQEGLTNVMRHSPSKEASVLFESPGESIFRFEIKNSIESNYSFVEGYGLKSMRERIEQAGGTLEVLTYHHQFIVRGTFQLNKEEANNNEESAIS